MLILIFLFLSGVHVYWALGGKWGLDAAIPTDPNSKKKLNPPPLLTAIVANGLFAFAVYYMLVAGWVQMDLPHWLLQLAGWGIPSIFLLRAIGDFQYVGLFKKVKGTAFAQADNRIFVPLCLVIAVLGFSLQLY